MKLPFCFQVSLMRFFRRIESANVVSLAPHGNACPPTIVDKNHTHETGLISSVWSTHVLGVARFINQSKIVQSVVGFVAVNMVNQTNWPTVVRKQPNKPMCFVNALANAHNDVALVIKTPCHISNSNTSGNAFAPHKFASFRTVLQYLFNFFGGKIGVAHLASPVMRLNINTGITK